MFWLRNLLDLSENTFGNPQKARLSIFDVLFLIVRGAEKVPIGLYVAAGIDE